MSTPLQETKLKGVRPAQGVQPQISEACQAESSGKSLQEFLTMDSPHSQGWLQGSALQMSQLRAPPKSGWILMRWHRSTGILYDKTNRPSNLERSSLVRQNRCSRLRRLRPTWPSVNE